MLALRNVSGAALRTQFIVRQLSVSAPAAAAKATDPIQKLFLQKIKEFDAKKK